MRKVTKTMVHEGDARERVTRGGCCERGRPKGTSEGDAKGRERGEGDGVYDRTISAGKGERSVPVYLWLH